MPMSTSMAALHSLGQYDQNEVQHDMFLPLALVLASKDADGVINGIVAFLRSGCLK